jgi:hypothetical protein
MNKTKSKEKPIRDSHDVLGGVSEGRCVYREAGEGKRMSESEKDRNIALYIKMI